MPARAAVVVARATSPCRAGWLPAPGRCPASSLAPPHPCMCHVGMRQPDLNDDIAARHLQSLECIWCGTLVETTALCTEKVRALSLGRRAFRAFWV